MKKVTETHPLRLHILRLHSSPFQDVNLHKFLADAEREGERCVCVRAEQKPSRCGEREREIDVCVRTLNRN